MTRVIGGAAGGRRLRTPPGSATRPTSDRVREALFSALEAQVGDWSQVRFLDLYAGSGAVGIEAASRGAAAVTAVEHDRRTARLVAANARDLGLDIDVRTATVARVLAEPPPMAYDVVFADPPYPLEEEPLAEVLTVVGRPGWTAADALVVVERSSRSPEPRWPTRLEPLRSRRYGETMLWYVRADPGS